MSEKLTPEEAWQDLIETSDVTSPEEYPNHALITLEQLREYMTSTCNSVPESGMFRTSTKHQFEAAGDERHNVVTPTPAPICPLAFRFDTGEWFVATGLYYKPVHSIDGTLFRDIDGGIWRLITRSVHTNPPALSE